MTFVDQRCDPSVRSSHHISPMPPRVCCMGSAFDWFCGEGIIVFGYVFGPNALAHDTRGMWELSDDCDQPIVVVGAHRVIGDDRSIRDVLFWGEVTIEILKHDSKEDKDGAGHAE